METTQPKKTVMETLILKMMLSWAILIIGFVALFAGCNNVPKSNTAANGYGSQAADDSVKSAVPDNTRADGILQKSAADTTAAHEVN
jgi:hypothetical protein